MPMRTSIEVDGDRARFVIATHDAVAHSALLAGGGDSRHGQLAADWVEVFAPVVFAPRAPVS